LCSLNFIVFIAKYLSMSTNWYNARKASQVAAFFCCKEGGQANVLKLTKLIYLADRHHIGRYGYPIIDDEYVSMPHGPVNSMTLNYIDGNIESEAWAEFICDRENHDVAAVREVAEEDLDELSEAEIESLNAVWNKFGGLGKYEIRDWTHKNCPEWEDPNGSANAISYEMILKFLGVENVEAYTQLRKDERQMAKFESAANSA